MPKKTDKENQQPSFEDALARLEEIVAQLEAGNASLEDAIAAFEEGTKLSQHCHELLAAAQGKIEKLVETSGGQLTAESFEVEE
jgi:exodeoxyribonuclease VII small subunit